MPRLVRHALPSNHWKQITAPGRYADGNGLYLEVSDINPQEARWWIWRGTVRGRRVERGMGGASYISLAEAREKAKHWRTLAKQGVDPGRERDKALLSGLTFEDAARQVWSEQVAPTAKNEKHKAQWIASLEAYAFPEFGNVPISDVTPADVKAALLKIWLDKPETARRVRQRLSTVFDWANVEGARETGNPVQGVTEALPKQRNKTKHHAALAWSDLPALMHRLEAAEGMGALALRFAILTAARSGEVRGATWAEVDSDAATWTIPADRMKAGLEHRVPLSAPALTLLEPLRGLSGGLVFPSAKKGKPLSDMTLAAVLKRLDVPVTVHGFRSTFRDWTEEATSYPHEVKEAALAHKVKNAVEAAYRRTDLFEKRRALMREWADFCGGGDG